MNGVHSGGNLSSAPNPGATNARLSLDRCRSALSSAPNPGATNAIQPVDVANDFLSSAPNPGATNAETVRTRCPDTTT